jgi:putative spermidine/putrescine transport system permease protein
MVPLLLAISYALLYSLGLTGLLNDGFTLTHWQSVLKNPEFYSSIGYSIYITAISLTLMLVFSLFTAWRMFRKKQSTGNIGLLFLPLTFPPLVAAFSWFYILSPGGILSRLSWHLGIIQDIDAFPRVVNDTFSLGIFVTHTFLIFPLFTLLFMYQIKKERMNELYDIATTLGTGIRQFFWKIFIPVLIKRSAPFILLYGILLFGAYEVPLLLGRSSPRMISVLITEKMTRFNLLDIPQGYVMAVLYSLSIITVTTLFIRKIKATW